MNIYIFDLDDTIANTEHRIEKYGLKELPNSEIEWDSFYEECTDDSPIIGTVDLMKSLAKDPDNHIVILTGRGRTQTVKENTKLWLSRYGIKYDHLILRDYDKYPPGVIKTADWKLQEIQTLLRISHKSKIIAIFEDRTENVNRMREAGYTVFQIENNDY